MRYIRKMTALILSIIFCIALVVGVGIIFAVKNINVTYLDCSGKYIAEYQKTKENLNELKGTQLLILNEESVLEKLSDNGVIAVESIEKVYPATVNIVLRERIECFVTENGDAYDIYDDRGQIMASSEKAYGIPVNAVDGSPDVFVDADVEFMPEIARLMSYFKGSFGGLRSLVSQVAVHTGVDAAVITMRSGMTIAISAWREGGDLKIARAHQNYLNMSDEQRTDGLITIA